MSSGAKGDMLSGLLGKVKDAGFCMSQIVMNHDTSANLIVCSHFPYVGISHCGNHTAKSFYYDLGKINPLSVSARAR